MGTTFLDVESIPVNSIYATVACGTVADKVQKKKDDIEVLDRK